jgi:poly(3-hydroxybutyrate) depolymerase
LKLNELTAIASILEETAMRKVVFMILLPMILLACKEKTDPINTAKNDSAFQITKTIISDSLAVDVVIDKPQGTSFDVLMVFHGTVTYDSLILGAAQNTLDGFKRILDREDMMIVSVAYPEENLLMGDNVQHAETALLWLKNNAAMELGIQIKKVFLAGHSQGGYVVTRLNTMHETNGVIANAPGPLNLIFRCKLEEDGKIENGVVCDLLKRRYGTTTVNPEAYKARSLLNFSSGYKSDILFVQGLDDSPIQMTSWPLFKQKVTDCLDCKTVQVHEVEGYGHQSLFENANAKSVFNRFITER